MSPLADKLAKLTPAARRLLEAKLRQKGIEIDRFQIPPRSADRDHYPLSFSQQRLWFLNQMEPDSSAYNIESPFRIEGPVEPRILRRALSLLVARHEALRTAFETVDDLPVQRVLRPFEQRLPLIDLTALGPAARLRVGHRLTRCHVLQPFDLPAGRPLRSAMVRHASRDHTVLLTMHHIVSDGWSLGVLYRELIAAYAALVTGRSPAFEALAIQYTDYAIWQREWQEREIFPRQLDYWREQMAGMPALLELPTDRPRPALQTSAGGQVSLRHAADLVDRLRGLARDEKTTLFVVLLAAFYAVMQRWTGVDDLAVGSPVAGRSRQEVEGLIGFFVNTVVLRADLSGGPTFRQLLRRVSEVNGEANANQDLPFEMLVDELQVERSLRHNPLFQVSFALQSDPGLEASSGLAASDKSGEPGPLSEVRISPQKGGYSATMFDLSVSFTETPQHLAGFLVYNLDLFDRTTVQRLSGRLTDFLESAIADPDRSIHHLSPLGAAERQQVLFEWVGGATPYPRQASIPALFAEVARRRPDARALSCESGSLSYAELNRAANRLAHRLRGIGAGPEVRIAVGLERSSQLVVALLAILKAGAAYVPLDLSLPWKRLSTLLEQADPALLLIQPGQEEKLPELSVPLLTLGDGARALEGESEADPEVEIDADNLAYIVFTSGSTGRPKGVAASHRGVVRLVRDTGYASLGAEEVFALLAPPSFDASTFELWAPLLNGGQLAILTAHQPSLEELGAFIARAGVTTLWLTAGLFHQMAELCLPALAGVGQILTGGDVVSPDQVAKVLASGSGTTMINGYGPTENTTFTCCYSMHREADLRAPLPIGAPIAQGGVLILDRLGRPLPVGAIGTLFATGDGLARGYFGQPALTAERFVPNPFPRRPGERMYDTGDRAGWSADGMIGFHGRDDGQVKIRGFRIELAEVETALLDRMEVRQVAVLAREFSPGDRRLCAYLVASQGGEIPSTTQLRDGLSATLPEYMIPSAFLTLEALPLSANGKVDRKALLAMAVEGPELEVQYLAPRTAIEESLAEIWSEVLGQPRVGVRDNFFDLGGHSLLATQVVSRVRRVLAVELSVRALFAKPTIEGLAAEVDGAEAGGAEAPPMVARHAALSGTATALSFAQQRLWFIDQLEPGSAVYNMPMALRLEGELKIAGLSRAAREIQRRHESLRTLFETVDSQPVQVIQPPPTRAIPLVDLSALDDDRGWSMARRLALVEASRGFDLEGGPLCRLRLFRLSGADHVFAATLHHIVSDGWSMGILVRELTALYTAFHAGAPSPLPDLELQYTDFAHWQRRMLGDGELERQSDYWKKELAGAPLVLELPTDRPRPAIQSFAGSDIAWRAGADLRQALSDIARGEQASLFMVLLAAYAVLLARLTGQTDLIVGSPIANRNRDEIEPLIGFFVNTLALRIRLEGGLSFRQLVAQLREANLDAYSHQDLPFERLVEVIDPQRDLSRQPIFQVMFVLENAPTGKMELPGLKLRPVAAANPNSRFEWTFSLRESEAGIFGGLEYATALFDSTTVRRALASYGHLLQAVVADPDTEALALDGQSPSERHQLLCEWNSTATDYPRDRFLHAWFERRAQHWPGSTALEFGDQKLSYGELNLRANRLARHLLALGVEREELVAVALERSFEMVVALMAILKAGAAYLPIDPSYPRQRLEFMLGDAEVRVLLTSEEVSEELPEDAAHKVLLDGQGEGGAAALLAGEGDLDDTNLGLALDPESLAYMIYTSGSTGQPKGAMNTHGAILNRVLWMQERYGLDGSDAVLQKTPFSFDVSVWEFFWPLAVGARLVIAEPGGHQESGYLVKLIAETQVTTLHFVPSMLRIFLEDPDLDRCAGVRRVLCSGEALPSDLARRFAERLPAELHNLYGPTEAAVDVTAWQCDSQMEEIAVRATVPIGRPIANLQIYLLDPAGALALSGAAGELAIGGAGLARGYWRRPGLTAEKFVPNPHGPAGTRLYQTGDLVRHQQGGEMEFLSRIDHQVKVRGFRIELGEIEAALLAHGPIREATVLAREFAPGDQRLVAYLVAAEGSEVPIATALRDALSAVLPDYMVPSAFLTLAAMPLSANGKVDRKALLELDAADGAEPRGRYVAPSGPIEEVLSEIWSEVLGVARVGVHDDFFALGGHSLLATQVVSRVRQSLAVELAVRSLFLKPTVRDLAVEVEVARRRADSDEVLPALVARPASAQTDGDYPLSFAQERLWFVCQMHAGIALYNLPTTLRLEGELKVDALARAASEIARRHQVLRSVVETVDGLPRQRILSGASSLPLVDLSGLAAVTKEDRFALRGRLIDLAVNFSFDLARGPLYLNLLLRLSTTDHIALFVLHHLISDGWSTGVLTHELATLYTAYQEAPPAPSPLADLPVQYADYAAWQRDWLRGERLEREIGYWRRRLEGAPPLLQLPLDRPRPAVATWNGGHVGIRLSRELTASLRAYGRQRGATLFMVLLAAFEGLLHRYSGQRDFCLGSPIAGRNRAEIEGLIGFFVNTLVLRAQLSAQSSLDSLTAAVREETLSAHAHQDLPFETLVRELEIERSLSHAPLFQVLFGVQNAPSQALELPGLRLSGVGAGIATARFDLALNVIEEEETISGAFGFKTDLFDRTTVARLRHHFAGLLAAAVAAPGMPVDQLQLLAPNELHQLLVEYNEPRPDYRVRAGVASCFATIAERQGDAVALIFDDGEGNQARVSYGALAAQVERLAHHLQGLGIGPEVVVGVAIPRSLEMVVSLLAVLRAGGAYLPLDLEYPPARLRFMMEDAQPEAAPRVVLVSALSGDRVPRTGATLVEVDQFLATSDGLDGGSAWREPALHGDHPAYVIYTSGSTGKPKGVVIPQRALANRLEFTHVADAGGPYRYLHKTTIGFDVSLCEIFQPLAAAAGSVVMAKPDGQWDLPYLVGLIQRQRVTHASFAPSVHSLLIDRPEFADCTSLEVVYTAGEAVSAELAQRFAALLATFGARFENRYGPTEATIGALAWSFDRDQRETAVPIGRPIARAAVHLLDAGLRPVASGVAGELAIAGDCLARSYLGRPARTAVVFVPDPFSGEAGARLYRTGDLGRRRGDGAIEFLGRVDHQVKIRGFRIELGEIETALASHPRLAEVAVVERRDRSGSNFLAAYYVVFGEGEAGRAVVPADLKAHLADSLPDYMVPSHFMELETMPTTSFGKIDRGSLPSPKVASGEPSPKGRRAPRDEVEGQIAAIWCELLEADAVDVSENFFDLGGHSLLLVRLQSRMRDEFGVEPSMVDLFRLPTVAAQAEFLRQGMGIEAGAAPPLAATLRTRRGVAASADHGNEVAIIGMACRYPGAADLESFWRLLSEGEESISFYSAEQLREFGIPDAAIADPRYVPAQAFLEGADLFDAALFGLTPRETQLLDPQHRIFLETAWSALEHAGTDPSTFEGEIGVYAGSSLSHYWRNLLGNPEIMASVGQLPIILGNDKDFLPTRVSYLLDLKGPSVAINCACSTSLVAAHTAVQNLLRGECDMALAGGVTVSGRERYGYLYEEGGVQSSDGHNRSYDTDAQGTMTSAGAGIVVLKRLEDAVAEGDTVWAVIRGSAVNNDGSDKIGFTAPSISGQARVIAEAQAAAGVDAAQIGMIEGHGSATPLGDPIEVAALNEVFGAGDPLPTASVALGSVKSNIGHAGSAAGVAGLIKTALSVAHGQLPPSVNFSQPNPKIDFANSPFFVNTELRSWESEGPRRAGVSAFGLGGTNAHIVVEEAPRRLAASPSRRWQLLPLSAASETALEAMTDRLAGFLEREKPPLAEVAFTLQAGRRRLAHRRFLVCRADEGAVDGAAQALASRDPRRLLGGKGGKKDRSVAYLLPGLGDHYPGMARGLYAEEATFRAAIDRCCELLRPQLGVDLRELLFAADAAHGEGVAGEPSDTAAETVDLRAMLGRGKKGGEGPQSPAARQLYRTRLAQPAVFVVEYALAQLWSEWGVEAEALLGYSLGEYTAACLAGVFSLPDALKVVAERARLIDALPAGSMVAVPLEEGELVALIAELDLPAEDGLSIAATQGPSITVAAGSENSAARLETLLEERGLAWRRLPTTHAFHSAMMRPIVEEFTAFLAGFELHRPRIPFVSNVTGDWIEEEEATDPAYWVRHLCGTVRFTEGLATLLAEDRLLVEVGPGQALGTSARQHPDHDGQRHAVIASLRDKRERRDDQAFVLEALGRAWSAGAAVDWVGFAVHEKRHRIALPTYPFDRRSYWVDPQPMVVPGARRQGKLPRIDDWFYVPAWRRVVATASQRPTSTQKVQWLFFSGPQGIGATAADLLEEEGYQVSRVRVGAEFKDRGDGRFEVNPAQAQDYGSLFDALRDQGREPGAIAHFWGAEVEEPAVADGAQRHRESYEATQPVTTHSLMALLGGIVQSGFVEPAALVFFSRGARQVEAGDRVRPEQEMALAALRVIPQEFRSLRCRCVDLPADLDEFANRAHQRLLAAVAAELTRAAAETTASSELCVALRASGRWERCFEAVEIPAETDGEPRLRTGGVYLLTGGLGRLGLAVAEMLASRYQAKLVLTARTALPPREEWQEWMATHPRSEAVSARMRRILAMETNGGEVLTLAVDAADREAMIETVRTVEERFGRLDGVVHLAGSLSDGISVPAEKTTVADCERHRATKVEGLWALEAALAGRELDFCLLFSSLSTALGGLGFAAYSAANGYLDSYAHRHNADHPEQPWISVGWDGWEYRDPTLTAQEQPVSNLGGLVMSAEESVEAFSRALTLFAVGQLVVSTGDLQLRLDTWYPEAETMEEEGSAAAASSSGETAPGVASGPRPELANPFVAPSDEVETTIAGIWEGLLGIHPVGIHDHYFELGGDSLLATQMTSRLRASFRVQLGLADLFANPTVAGVAELIRGGGEKPLDDLEALLGDIESMDESEATQRLEESTLSSVGSENVESEEER